MTYSRTGRPPSYGWTIYTDSYHHPPRSHMRAVRSRALREQRWAKRWWR